ncbi:hypothetical protein IscW_ISCW023428 [Ixodes scapularis]|uniref:HTH OST-type domain-containing protein n=1 Tax=Ixodes scapularis TaxID=6945 RepID=B7QJM2_IXOSC|nr:hypothetical protein IscW_ISCW023428 [Ixodes scapularis]|eukprot:XP_002415379.1 hypothetical protein IscW_ISCW023428 [Ixodes scapularis]
MSSRQEELETVKAIIRALLIADKRTFTVRQFINEYRSSEGQNFPYAKFGHSDPLNFLRSLTDTVQVYQFGSEFYVKPNVTQDVQHVQKLLMRVKSNIKELLSTCVDGITLGQLEEMYARKHSTGINYTLFGHVSLESFVFSIPKNPGPPELPLTEDWTPKRTMPAVPAASRPPPACADLKLRSIGTRSSSLSSSSSSSVIVGGATGGGDLPLNPKVVSGFKRMFSNHPDGIWLKDFAEVYESETGQELRVGELGFSTLLQLLENCAGTLEVKRPVQGGDFMVCQVDRQRQPILEPRVLSTLESALRASDSRGLSLDELLQAYQDLSGVPLSPSDHGFTRQAFVLFLTGQLPVVYEPLGKGQFVLKWSDTGREDSGLVEAPPVARAPVASPPLLAYGPFRVQEGLVDREYCPVYVSQVFSIHNFYVQLKGNDTSLQLEVLMNELETVYEGHSSDTQVVDERHIRPGFPCAAPYTYSDGSSDWHRGMVVSVGQDPLSCKVVSPQSVVPTEWARLVISLQVLYVDYGTMAEVKKTMLRTLK